MTFLFNFLAKETFGFLLLLLEKKGASTSYAVYEVKTSLTPIGWALIVIFPTAVILGAIYLAVKIFKKPKLK